MVLAHVLDDGGVVMLARSLDATSRGLGVDGDAYRRLIGPLVDEDGKQLEAVLGPPLLGSTPLHIASFGLRAIRSAHAVASARFRTAAARALFAGLAAHAQMPLEAPASAAPALVLAAAAHRGGWPFARGGSGTIVSALVQIVLEGGGTLHTGVEIDTLPSTGRDDLVLFDLAPRHVARIAGESLPGRYRAALERFRHGPGAFKLDLVLDGPVPWLAPEAGEAGTVHCGGSFAEIAAAEREVAAGQIPARPFVMLCQPSRCDPTRAPAGQHVVWAYCHVPAGSPVDMTGAIESQIERFAPGFRERVIARHATTPADFERYNANNVGGDIGGGEMSFRQLVARPVARRDPYRTPNRRLFLCSASTPPGGGVHGLCGYFAARSALRSLGIRLG